MVRTQVQLTEQQQAALRRLSAATGRSVADLVREGIERMLASRVTPDRETRVARAIALAGRYSSGRSDGSAEHDKHLAEAFR
jgi:Arc/MetJ-type ribon-helix-helix transcriptional regulator